MVDRDLVAHSTLVERFQSAIARFELDARAERDLPACIENLHQVERDLLQVAETPIDLPGWLSD